MPSTQVMTFQTIAPVSALNTTCASTMSGLMIPAPIVLATCNPNTRKAMKLKNAAQATAQCGLSTRVDTTVAIELAASCKPLRKSNSSATAISATSSEKESIAPALRRDRSRSEEHTSELQSLMRISYAVFCLKKNK